MTALIHSSSFSLESFLHLYAVMEEGEKYGVNIYAVAVAPVAFVAPVAVLMH